MGIVTDQVLDSNKLMASDTPKTSQLLGEIGQPDGMMKDPVGAVVVGVGPLTVEMSGRLLLYAPAIAFTMLSPPMVNITMHAPTPHNRA
ncbi:hypothetical protein NL676_001916 [Syzygium grande]|nr:hypothetical protein NL676_001916 [Syzygium grande]